MTIQERAANLKAQTATLNAAAKHFQTFHKLYIAATTLAARRKAETMTAADFKIAVDAIAYEMIYDLWNLDTIPDANPLPTP